MDLKMTTATSLQNNSLKGLDLGDDFGSSHLVLCITDRGLVVRWRCVPLLSLTGLLAWEWWVSGYFPVFPK